MTVTGEGHLGGDPAENCGKIVIETDDWLRGEVGRMATLYRVLTNPDQRAKLLDGAEYIEAEAAAALDPAFA